MGNYEKNNFVIKEITSAVIEILQEKPLEAITISEIAGRAKVARNSFYRNFQSKEDIIKTRIRALLTVWYDEYQSNANGSNSELYGSLFGHLKDNSEFYLLLKRRDLFYLFHEVYIEMFGAGKELDNMSAYIVSFIAYGTLGWIEEWIKRGMQESAGSMAELLARNGMK